MPNTWVIYYFSDDGSGGDPAENPMLRGDYNPDEEDRLCTRCQQINFRRLFETALQHDTLPRAEIIIICSEEDLKARAQDCHFCRLLAKRLLSPSPSGNGFVDLNGLPAMVTISSKVAEGVPWLTLEASNLRGGILAPLAGLEFSSRSEVEPWERSVLRRVGPKYDPAIVKRWITACVETCQHDCRTTGHALGRSTGDPREDGTPPIQRFIDIKYQCLVEAAALPGAQGTPVFAALSYVWGDKQRTTLKQENKDQLQKHFSLAPTQNDIVPRTIRDAMTVCADLGVPLLWVDALCIQQDGADKMQQINNMHHVYRKALFTIVAASGSDADAGLSRVLGKSDQQMHIRAQGLTIIDAQPAPDKVIHSTHWSRRAWTYQEFLLSPRRLFLTNGIMHFICDHGIFREDFADPHAKSGLPLEFQAPVSGYEIQWGGSSWKTYADCVSAYTAKDLTEPADAMSAFTAIIKTLERDFFPDTKFAWGVPESYMDKALLWRRCYGCHCAGSRKGLQHRDEITLPDGTNKPAPSWSWLSRKGHLKYGEPFFPHGEPPPLFIPKENYWVDGGVEWVDEEGHLSWSEPAGPGIQLLAEIARLRIANEWEIPMLNLASREDENGRGRPRPAYDISSGARCGMVYPDQDENTPAGNYWFVKISQTTFAAESRLLPGLKRDHLGTMKERSHHPLKWDDYVDKQVYDCRRPWAVYNVLMVTLEEDKATRIGVGQVHEDAFDNSPLFQRREIRLV